MYFDLWNIKKLEVNETQNNYLDWFCKLIKYVENKMKKINDFKEFKSNFLKVI